MRPFPAFLSLAVASLTLTPLRAADVASPPPGLVSLRGRPANTLEELNRKNGAILSEWRKQLTAEQRAAWLTAMGYPAESERRIDRQKIPTATTGYDWRTVARFAGLRDEELAQLDRDKLLLEDIALRQSFEAYTMPRGPVFITSDATLNAFHVLFEDGFRELELRRAFTLRRQLENVVTKARAQMASKRNVFSVEELRPGWRHAQFVIGPALRLLGTPGDFFDADAREEIERQVDKIRAADRVELPSWLAPHSRTLLAIDYRACKPVGFYTGSESLQNYFRAVRWLQSVPFRADRDNELTAIGLLGYATMEDYRQAHAFFREYHALLGRPDDPTLPDAAYEFQNFLSTFGKEKIWSGKLAATRHWLLRSALPSSDWKKLNDTLRLPPDVTDKLAEIQFRVLSAARLPDSLTLAHLSAPGRLPSGLAVAALLGSDFARRQLAHLEPAKLDAALALAREDWHPTKNRERHTSPSLYDRYLDTLAALHVPAEPDAPAFMRNDAWAAKSCLTTLASWAQMRHTFTLQAKQSIHYFGLVDVPPGFVEPNPEFFRRLADLVEFTERSLDEAEVFLPSAALDAERLRSAANDLEALGLHVPGSSVATLERLTPEQQKRYHAAVGALEASDAEPHPAVVDPGDTPEEFQKNHRELIATLRQRAAALASGETNPAAQRSSSRKRWDTLKSVTRRLEALAHKQLRQQPWSIDEERFIRGFGEQLAFVHGYFGNSWLTPRDDAPRWATVASDPATDTNLAVATGRARLIRVLYPYRGGEVLCTGAVMSYYEYPEKSRALTDEEWKTKLDSAAPPPLPAWLSPFLAR